jgi:hypothetical protein
MKTFVGSVFIFKPNVFHIKALYHTLGCIYKFIQRNEKFDMIDPWLLYCQEVLKAVPGVCIKK